MIALRRLGTGVAVLLVMAACSGGSDAEETGLTRAGRATTTSERVPTSTTTPATTVTTAPPADEPLVIEPALTNFDSCETLLAEVKQEAMSRVGPWGLEGGGFMTAGARLATEDSATAAPASGDGAAGGESAAGGAASGTGGEGGGPAFSGTNLQEQGVDEPDLVKTDGTRIVALAGNQLHHIVLEEGRPRLAASITLTDGWPTELFLAGNRVLVLGQSENVVVHEEPAEADEPAASSASPGTRQQDRYEPSATLWAIDIGENGTMRVAEVLRMEGMYLSARMVDGIVRLVLSSPQQGPAFVYPDDDTPEAHEAAAERNRQIVAASTVQDWLPSYSLVDHRGPQPAVSETGRVCSCRDTMQTSEFSGFGALSVVTIDPHDPRPDDAVSVMADGQVVYSSTTGLYVATNRWEEQGGTSTQIHKFDISDRRTASYRASGDVPGQILNQWALSEHEGHLRVATTLFDSGGGSESLVTVLAEGDERLVPVGQVGDLGRGEQIYAVRYIGDLGYVVTFRQTDPLYVIDLSDPTKPGVLGELKILGYSAYLHPIGDGLLLGVGQDATEDGLRQGTQVSVFDVSDASQPRRLHQAALGTRGTYSDVEWDHRAFLYWPPAGTAVIPLSGWAEDTSSSDGGRPVLQAVVLRAGGSGIGEAGRVTHQGRPTSSSDGWPQIQRSIVVGDTLYTVSPAGVLGSDLGSLADRSWVRF